jgi:hypothetical protein
MAVNWKEPVLISGLLGPHRQAAGVSRAGLGITHVTEGHSRLAFGGWRVGRAGARAATAESAVNLFQIKLLMAIKTYPLDAISHPLDTICHLSDAKTNVSYEFSDRLNARSHH